MSQASKLISAAALGLDFQVVLVAGTRYVIHPPTIRKLIGAAHYLSDFDQPRPLQEVLLDERNLASLPIALSYLIQGDDTLADALSQATPDELAAAITTAYSLISVTPFSMLSLTSKSVTMLAARPRP